MTERLRRTNEDAASVLGLSNMESGFTIITRACKLRRQTYCLQQREEIYQDNPANTGDS